MLWTFHCLIIPDSSPSMPLNHGTDAGLSTEGERCFHWSVIHLLRSTDTPCWPGFFPCFCPEITVLMKRPAAIATRPCSPGSTAVPMPCQCGTAWPTPGPPLSLHSHPGGSSHSQLRTSWVLSWPSPGTAVALYRGLPPKLSLIWVPWGLAIEVPSVI